MNARFGDLDRAVRLQRLPPLHPGLQRVERLQRRVDAERQRRALGRGGGVGEDAIARCMALDAVEQQRRALRRAGGDFGDAAELEARIGAVDAPQRAELVHLLDEAAQILVDHHTRLWPAPISAELSHGVPYALHRCLQSFQPEALFRCAAGIAGRAEGHRQAGAGHSGAVRSRAAAEGGRSVSRLHPDPLARPADARPAVGAGQDPGNGEARQRRPGRGLRQASRPLRRLFRGGADERAGGCRQGG